MPVTPIRYPTPKPLPNPWHVPNTYGQSITTLNPGPQAAPAPAPAAAPVPVAPAPPPPPPPDFAALANADPQYTTGIADLNRQNDTALAGLLRGYLEQSQSYQDNANAHGALFSGAATHAQNYASQNYADQQKQQADNLLSGQHQLYYNVYNRLIAQLSGLNPGGA